MVKKRKLRRSKDKLLTGVCGGIAEWYGVEPMFVRLFYLLTAAASAVIPGVIVYLVLWWAMPAADAEADA